MKRILSAALAAVLLLALPVSAATTWSGGYYGSAGSVATCTTGTESAPTLVTQGLDLGTVTAFAVHAEAAGTMTAGGALRAYLWNPRSSSWNRAPDLDLTVAALTRQAFAGFKVEAPMGRLAYVPEGVGVAVTIYINGFWFKQ